MKNKKLSKMLVCGSAFAMIFGLMPGIGMGKVEAAPSSPTRVIKSSEIKESVHDDCEIPFEDGELQVILEMDEELNVMTARRTRRNTQMNG